jgi:hypothetical protein
MFPFCPAKVPQLRDFGGSHPQSGRGLGGRELPGPEFDFPHAALELRDGRDHDRVSTQWYMAFSHADMRLETGGDGAGGDGRSV